MAHNSYIYTRKIRRFKENINSFSLLATSAEIRREISMQQVQEAIYFRIEMYYILHKFICAGEHFKSFISILIPRT